MQLDTSWCMQLNASPQLAKAALKVLLPFATNNEDMRAATSNKEPHCSMIIEKNNKRAMSDCWCTLL